MQGAALPLAPSRAAWAARPPLGVPRQFMLRKRGPASWRQPQRSSPPPVPSSGPKAPGRCHFMVGPQGHFSLHGRISGQEGPSVSLWRYTGPMRPARFRVTQYTWELGRGSRGKVLKGHSKSHSPFKYIKPPKDQPTLMYKSGLLKLAASRPDLPLDPLPQWLAKNVLSCLVLKSG